MPRPNLSTFILPAALALAACGGGAPDGPRGAQAVFTPAASDSCGATGYSDRIGKAQSAFDFSAPGRAVRIIGPDMAMTMDYNPARLNVDTDGRGRITRIWCG
ncbi:I78 family peptidase inhibitor [Roseovarius nanhaiticus]|uniref:Peptidase inhibitor I78 family protein n=1 Tax=Roseovarius nanhaiticus TaxID=573024 RepID=A0A1N7FKC1_9RHOB|nr:I78 family peptidase inhibitor [Roseovarius nanhaiticus]SEK52691.1 Peptidase inhibitor I78 family protein [Roseovarius nanhaiticus]SIS00686.1 Peptidase inhibitor I78 family protein [Roseovarius nanhaiticus]